jgi:adenylate cyclase
LLLEFPSVVNAVRCAVEVQTAMASKTVDVPEDRRIAFRTGINIRSRASLFEADRLS